MSTDALQVVSLARRIVEVKLLKTWPYSILLSRLPEIYMRKPPPRETYLVIIFAKSHAKNFTN